VQFFTDCIQNLPALATLLGGGTYLPIPYPPPARCAYAHVSLYYSGMELSIVVHERVCFVGFFKDPSDLSVRWRISGTTRPNITECSRHLARGCVSARRRDTSCTSGFVDELSNNRPGKLDASYTEKVSGYLLGLFSHV